MSEAEASEEPGGGKFSLKYCRSESPNTCRTLYLSNARRVPREACRAARGLPHVPPASVGALRPEALRPDEH